MKKLNLLNFKNYFFYSILSFAVVSFLFSCNKEADPEYLIEKAEAEKVYKNTLDVLNTISSQKLDRSFFVNGYLLRSEIRKVFDSKFNNASTNLQNKLKEQLKYLNKEEAKSNFTVVHRLKTEFLGSKALTLPKNTIITYFSKYREEIESKASLSNELKFTLIVESFVYQKINENDDIKKLKLFELEQRGFWECLAAIFALTGAVIAEGVAIAAVAAACGSTVVTSGATTLACIKAIGVLAAATSLVITAALKVDKECGSDGGGTGDPNGPCGDPNIYAEESYICNYGGGYCVGTPNYGSGGLDCCCQYY